MNPTGSFINSYVNSFLAFKWYPGVTLATINADIRWWTQNYCSNACQFNDM